MEPRRLNIVVGIATAGRHGLLVEMMNFLARQSRAPDTVVLCPLPTDGLSADQFADFPFPVQIVCGPRGLCAQRNMILSAVQTADVIVFFDDDFLPRPDYIANLETLFIAQPEISSATGTLLADGINGPGYSVTEGITILNQSTYACSGNSEQIGGCYGCNMAYRFDFIRQRKLQFDENLPLYGWQEDVDFSVQMSASGPIFKTDTLLGVHLGVKSGRTSGVRLGYSQIANPIYLTRKGTMSWRHAGQLMSRNLSANVLRSLHPEPWIDRAGRLKGNMLALVDLFRGRVSPMKILQL